MQHTAVTTQPTPSIRQQAAAHTTHMNAIVYTRYGGPDVLTLTQVEKPSPKVNQVLIKVHATTVSTGDVNMRGFTFVPPGFGPLPRLMFGLRAPKKQILGCELAGVVEAVGKDVTRFKPGDRVFGINSTDVGAYAEYVCWPETSALVHIPAGMTYEDAAAIPFGAGTALAFVRDMAKVRAGQKVLVIGAAGGVGSYAVQLARYYGADVTGVCSTSKVELVRSLGASSVIDYTRQDDAATGRTYDAIIDTVPGRASFARAKAALTPTGLYLPVAGGPRELVQALFMSRRKGKKVVAGPVSEKPEAIAFLAELAAAGHIRPVIDRVYPFEQAAEAHRHADTGHKAGSVVIRVS